MSFKTLGHTEKGILKGLISGAVSTSEGIATGFVNGDLSFFSGHYTKFSDAWDRLDGEQKDAVIELREFCGIDRLIITSENFVTHFIEWQIKRSVDKAEMAYFNKLRGDYDEEEAQLYFNENIAPKHHAEAQEYLSKHL